MDEKNNVMYNGGVGVPFSHGVIPTVNISGEVGFMKTGDIGLVSLGGLAEFQLGNYRFSDYTDEIFPRFYLGGRAAWHVHAFNSKIFDAYAGIGFGVLLNGKTEHSNNILYDSEPPVAMQPDFFVGGRWMFSSGTGLFAEIGYTGLSTVKFGLTFNL